MTYNIADIKRIIDRFYNGEATPDEISQVTAYFASEDVTDESLMMDRDIFLAMQRMAEETEMPDELTGRVVRSTIGRKSNRHILPWIVSAISSAAVVCLILITSPLERTSHANNESQAMATLLETPDTPAVETQQEVEVTTVDTSFSQEPSTETSENQVTVTKKVPKKVVKKKAKTMPDSKATAKEKEATRLSIELINRALSKADIAYANAEETFMEIERKLNEQ